ncbi:MAG TPA: DUF11 domain-containing protein [Thermoanaerobaculia bacterium]|nr:DUF11 domain-containing protein [Thermoanaerobaculia bacterium]
MIHSNAVARSIVVASLALLLSVPAVGHAQEVKDPQPPSNDARGLQLKSTGGPDSFGYTFADADEPTCAATSVIDITGTGTNIASGDDSASAPQALSAPFNFYGTAVTQLVMATNGYLSTDPTDTGPDLSNDCPLPAPPSTGGGARIYPLHDDLITDSGFIQYFATCPRQSDRCTTNEDCTIFMWNDVEHFGGGGQLWDFEAILYHDTNDIVYLVGPGNPETGSGSTSGIQNFPPPTIGLTYACNVAGSVGSTTGNSTVCVFHPNAVPSGCLEADLALTKSAAPPNVSPGDNVVYTLTVSNNGPGGATGVVVTDSLPAQVTYVSNDCGAGFASPTVTWNVGALANGGSATCNVTVAVNAGVNGAVVNSATASGAGVDPVSSNNVGTATINVQQATIDIPTLSTLGLAALVLLVAGAALFLVRRGTAA